MPTGVRESAYGLGATTAAGRDVGDPALCPLRRHRGGHGWVSGPWPRIGETMAVTFIIGTIRMRLPEVSVRPRLDDRLDDRQRIHRGDVSPVHVPAALIALGLVLFLITFTVLGFAQGLSLRMQGAPGYERSEARPVGARRRRRVQGLLCWRDPARADRAQATILWSLS